MGIQENLSRDLTNSSDLKWRSESQGAIDRVTAKGFTSGAWARHAQLEALGSALWGYKLPKTQDSPPDGFEKLRKDRCERDKHEAYLMLSFLLRWTRGMGHFNGPKNAAGDYLIARSGWHMLAVAAIEEWVNDLCRHCHGAGELVMGNGVITTCPVCHGHRKHRYSDEERAPTLIRWSNFCREAEGVPQTTEASPAMAEAWNHGMDIAHGLISSADREMAQRMGRWLAK